MGSGEKKRVFYSDNTGNIEGKPGLSMRGGLIRLLKSSSLAVLKMMDVVIHVWAIVAN